MAMKKFMHLYKNAHPQDKFRSGQTDTYTQLATGRQGLGYQQYVLQHCLDYM